MEFTRDIGFWHERTSRRTFKRALRHVSFLEEKSFFDFGCGKGHALILAEQHSFKRLGGVELSPAEFAICQRNLEKHQLNAVELYQQDARDLKNELDDYDLLFLFNPFGEQVLSDVANNLIDSVQRKKRQITLIYQNPMFHDILVNKGFSCFMKLSGRHINKIRRVNLYTYSLPSAS